MRKYLLALATVCLVAGVAAPAIAHKSGKADRPSGERCVQKAQSSGLSAAGKEIAVVACNQRATAIRAARATLRAAHTAQREQGRAARQAFRAAKQAAAALPEAERKAAMAQARAARKAAFTAIRTERRAAHKATVLPSRLPTRPSRRRWRWPGRPDGCRHSEDVGLTPLSGVDPPRAPGAGRSASNVAPAALISRWRARPLPPEPTTTRRSASAARFCSRVRLSACACRRWRRTSSVRRAIRTSRTTTTGSASRTPAPR